MTPKRISCYLPEPVWRRIVDLAHAERRSAHAQLEVIVERGLDGLAGYELNRLAAERSSRLMEEAMPASSVTRPTNRFGSTRSTLDTRTTKDYAVVHERGKEDSDDGSFDGVGNGGVNGQGY